MSASLDQQRRLFQSGIAGQKNVGIDMLIPFPNKLRLQGKVAQADVASSEFSYALQRQLIAAQTAEAYDSLLVALKHRADLTESETLAKDFLAKTQARFNARCLRRGARADATIADARAAAPTDRTPARSHSPRVLGIRHLLEATIVGRRREPAEGRRGSCARR